MRQLISGLFILVAMLLASPTYAVEPHEYAVKSQLASKALLLDVEQVGRRLVAVGQYGHIIYSDNQGRDWQQAENVPTRNTLTDVLFIDNKTGFAVGHESVILKTSDGGATWALKHIEQRGEDPLFGIYFSGARYGVVVGAFSRMMETHDGGETWRPRALIEDAFDDFHLNAIFADRRGNVFIPAEFGTVYKSTDKARSFVALETPYDGSFWGGIGLDNNDVLIWGMRGNAFISDDEGKSWQASTTNTDRSISGGVQLRNGDVVLTGLSGLVLVSDDDGRSFTASVRPDRRSFETVAAGADKNKVLLFGVPGVVEHQLQ